MYANVVSISYKSRQDAEEAVKKLQSDILPQVRKLPGFQRFQLVRTGEMSTLHIGVFETPEQAEQGRSSVYPQLRDMVLPHAAAAPVVQHGPIAVSA